MIAVSLRCSGEMRRRRRRRSREDPVRVALWGRWGLKGLAGLKGKMFVEVGPEEEEEEEEEASATVSECHARVVRHKFSKVSSQGLFMVKYTWVLTFENFALSALALPLMSL